jgi:hypothetical protein
MQSVPTPASFSGQWLRAVSNPPYGLGGRLRSLICNPKVCRGVAFGQEFSVYSRVYLAECYALTEDIRYFLNTLLRRQNVQN